MADDEFKRIIDAWQRNDTAAKLIGERSHLAIAKRLKGSVGSVMRRKTRSDAIVAIVDAVTQAGFNTSAGEINRYVKMYQTAKLLCIDSAPRRTLRVLSPLVIRNAKNEEWTIRSGKGDDAHALVARLDTLDVDQVGLEVNRILGRKPRVTAERVKPTAAQKAVKQLVAMSSADVREMLHQLREADKVAWRVLFATVKSMSVRRDKIEPVIAEVQPVEQISVPMPPPPGKKSLLGRLAG